MARKRRLLQFCGVLLGASLIAAACGSDDSDSGEAGEGTTASTVEGDAGGELIDIGTFAIDTPEHIDPALNVTLDAYQVVNALYDGLTEVDYTDPENAVVKPLVAESYEANEDATEWVFTIKEDQKFSTGEPVLPSSFVRAWERASDPEFAGDYSYLFNFIEGGAEKLDGTAETISGVTADDEAMTLTVKLAEPYSNFDAVAGFQLFFPMPSEVDDLSDQGDWENGLMIGNGPYKLESPRTDQEIVLVRNDEWAGDIFGNTRATLDRIRFVISADIESAFNAFEAGEGDVGRIPPGRFTDAQENYGNTVDQRVLGTYHFELRWDDAQIGGPDNKLLRQAISQAINRDEINEAVYEGTRIEATGVTPAGIPGFEDGLCDYCAYDKDAAQAAYDQWKATGKAITNPIKINLNAGGGHEPVVQIMVDNLAAIGIPAVADPLDSTTYFSQLADGACIICRSGWYADYPTYDNFMYDLFHSDAIGGNNHGYYANPKFDELVDQAKATVDPDERGELFRQAEDVLLNEDIAVIPINWRTGDYVYNEDVVTNFEQNPQGLIFYETVTVQ